MTFWPCVTERYMKSMNLHDTAFRNSFFFCSPKLFILPYDYYSWNATWTFPSYRWFFLHVRSTLLTPSWCTICNSRDHIISTLYFKDNKIMHLEWEIVERGGYTDPFQFQWRLQWKMLQVQIVFHTHHDIRSPRLHVHLFSNWRQRSYSHAPSD